jgi:hypothetical protein
VRVEPPTPERTAACSRLHDALPGALDGRDGRETAPGSDLTAAWGDPPVVLRCGVPRPAAMTATSEVIEVDGVEWFLEEPDGAFLFTTTGRTAYVEVRVPAGTPRTGATAPLVDLAPAVTGTIPRG